MELTGNWFAESVSPDLAVLLRLRAVLFSGATAYQKVEVLDSEVFGRSLVLDGKTQSTEVDEFIYHESLVHPAMLFHPDPKSVFIGGGGEGGTLREVLAHRSVESATMIDLDREVVELCRAHLPNHHRGSFDDPRVTLRHEDARAFLQSGGDGFDVIVLDLVDPLEEGTAYLLYTDEFYRIAKARLNPGGVLVTQSGPAGLPNHRECFTTIFHTLSEVFTHAAAAQVHVPAFQTLWGFTIASDAPLQHQPEPGLDAAIAGRISKPLRHYDGGNPPGNVRPAKVPA
ncbi:Thermospermine synthase ACAULIS5 [Geodia barretti]|uniref:thermospermine synthase n=1 Tax=Geodia barretti TaxID=519541 RepID=A0AA35WHH1_GEOBA|nr:Thermospermine synthase ACAULIS5 [Geodia barretti]